MIGTSNFIETLPLNDCQPRLKSNLTTHEMEIILRQTSNRLCQEDYKIGYQYTILFPQTFVKDGFIDPFTRY